MNKRFILRYIKPGDRILDMGGGPGRYAIWLSEIGCDATLVDLSKNNIDYALEMAAQRGLVLRVIQAEALAADKAYFSDMGWFESQYNTKVKLDPIRMIFGSLVDRMIRHSTDSKS